MNNGIDPLNKYQCQVCGRVWPVHSLTLSCEAKHDLPHEGAK